MYQIQLYPALDFAVAELVLTDGPIGRQKDKLR